MMIMMMMHDVDDNDVDDDYSYFTAAGILSLL